MQVLLQKREELSYWAVRVEMGSQRRGKDRVIRGLISAGQQGMTTASLCRTLPDIRSPAAPSLSPPSLLSPPSFSFFSSLLSLSLFFSSLQSFHFLGRIRGSDNEMDGVWAARNGNGCHGSVAHSFPADLANHLASLSQTQGGGGWRRLGQKQLRRHHPLSEGESTSPDSSFYNWESWGLRPFWLNKARTHTVWRVHAPLGNSGVFKIWPNSCEFRHYKVETITFI